MNNKINWIADFNKAIEQSKKSNKNILLDFFNPN